MCKVGRVAEALTDQEMSRRAAKSIWWGVLAIGLMIWRLGLVYAKLSAQVGGDGKE